MIKKHVYLLDEGSRAAVYGIGTYIRQMIFCLSRMENIVLHLIRLNSNAERFELVERDGYEELNIPSPCLPVGEKPERYYRNAWYLLWLNSRVTNEESVDFLLNYSSQHYLITEIRKIYPYCRIFFTIHYQDWCFTLDGNVSRFRKIISSTERSTLDADEVKVYDSFLKEKKLYSQVDKIICLSHFTEELLWNEYEIPRNKTTSIYNGLKDEVEFCLPAERMRLKEELGFENTEKIVLYVGRLDPIKGVRLLIRAFRLLLEQSSDCCLLLVGDGDFACYLKECDRYWNKIIFTGRLEKERLYQLYQIVDVGVLPSMHEQCSYTAIEMMMFDIPLIASTTTGLKEMIRENQNGLLFDMQNEDDTEATTHVMELLKKALLKSVDIENKSFHPRLDYIEKYSIDKMKYTYEKLLG